MRDTCIFRIDIVDVSGDVACVYSIWEGIHIVYVGLSRGRPLKRSLLVMKQMCVLFNTLCMLCIAAIMDLVRLNVPRLTKVPNDSHCGLFDPGHHLTFLSFLFI
jgi:hypothetical protein